MPAAMPLPLSCLAVFQFHGTLSRCCILLGLVVYSRSLPNWLLLCHSFNDTSRRDRAAIASAG